ncbi:hypothetical protein [Neisseria meningitidis]|uniref:hypothetical protein n=1 Tax=Neisseria meningitidis TaxID=487 RepID=UPI00215D8454|nr:hypothetical protein [Neisseria meningitidis]
MRLIFNDYFLIIDFKGFFNDESKQAKPFRSADLEVFGWGEDEPLSWLGTAWECADNAATMSPSIRKI